MMAAQPEKTSILQRLGAVIGLNEVFFFGGVIMLSVGAAQVYAPAGLIVPGAIFAWLGYSK